MDLPTVCEQAVDSDDALDQIGRLLSPAVPIAAMSTSAPAWAGDFPELQSRPDELRCESLPPTRMSPAFPFLTPRDLPSIEWNALGPARPKPFSRFEICTLD